MLLSSSSSFFCNHERLKIEVVFAAESAAISKVSRLVMISDMHLSLLQLQFGGFIALTAGDGDYIDAP